MKKLLAAAASVFLLTTGAAFAQTDADVSEEGVTIEIARDSGLNYDTSQFVGASLPLPLGLHYGLEDIALFGTTPDLRFRLSGNFLFAGNITLGADAMFDITQIEDIIQIYGGPSLELGTTLAFASPSIGLGAFVGGEYRFNQELGFYVELGTGVAIPIVFVPRVSLGVNYHF